MLILPEPPRWDRAPDPNPPKMVELLAGLNDPVLLFGRCRTGCEQGDKPRAIWTLVINRDGSRIAKLRAVPCGHVIKDRGATRTEATSLPVWADHRDGTPCARCGATDGVQNHHWAPRELFHDADYWPQSDLCTRCHTRWHQTIDQSRRRGAA